jgi:sulfate adenylyltransferase
LGLYYDENRLNTIFDSFKNIKIEIKTTETYVYCNQCRTLVSTTSCPHGSHHHIRYHSPSILRLIENGIMPPSILVRREVSASILSALFPNRFDDDLQEIYYALMPSSGIIEKPSQEDFYVQLMGLYQTSSLT